MKKIAAVGTQTMSNDHRLTRTTPLGDFQWAEAIEDLYQKRTVDKVLASLLNAIYTERKSVFLVTSRSLAELATKDPNSDLEYSTDKNGRYNPLNSEVYKALIHHLSGIPVDSITGKPNFAMLREHATEKDAMIWSLNGDYLNDFFEAIPESKKSYEMLKKSAESFGKTPASAPVDQGQLPGEKLGENGVVTKDMDYYRIHRGELDKRIAELDSTEFLSRTKEHHREMNLLAGWKGKYALEERAQGQVQNIGNPMELPTRPVSHGVKVETVTGPATIDKEDLITLATENQAQGLVLELDRSMAWCVVLKDGQFWSRHNGDLARNPEQDLADVANWFRKGKWVPDNISA